MRLRSLALALLVFAGAGCFVGSPVVTRVVHGKRVPGRFVKAEAYAAYLQGAMLEAEGREREAIAAYREALRHDPESPDPWTRIGASLCALGDPDPWAAFDRASSLDPTYDAAWAERARCHLAREEHGPARLSARRAVALEPLVLDNALLLTRALELSGDLDEARRWLDGLVAAHPASVEAHRARLDFALRTGDRVREEASAERLAELAPDSVKLEADAPSLSPLARLDQALLDHDLEAARRWALTARRSAGWIALRAIELGRIDEAKAQAELVFAADPADSDARVALLWLAQVERDDTTLRATLAKLPKEAGPLSELGARLLDELLRRRLGPGFFSAAADQL